MSTGPSLKATLDAYHFSAEDWVDGACRAALARCVPWLEDAIRPWYLEGIVLGGSACFGEAIGWDPGGRADQGEPFVLSDLDLAVVTRRGISQADRARIVREAQLKLRSASGPAVCLGFYGVGDLDRQAPTLGMVDLARHGLVLHGSANLAARFRAPSPERVPPWESWRLVGNRAMELLAAPRPAGGPQARVRSWHALAKLAAGLWSAQLVVEGRYVCGFERRCALLERAPAVPGQGGARGGEGADAAETVATAARTWAGFLRRPRPEEVPTDPARFSAVQAALVSWVRQSGSAGRRGRGRELPERILLDEPIGSRERLRRWRSEGRRRGIPRARALLEALWHGVDPLSGTPEGRRLGAAILYWRLLPERPEPVWGPVLSGPTGAPSAEDWVAGTRRFLGQAIEGGPGCRDRLEALLGLRTPDSRGSS